VPQALTCLPLLSQPTTDGLDLQQRFQARFAGFLFAHVTQIELRRSVLDFDQL
jgi:hypothetical protein